MSDFEPSDGSEVDSRSERVKQSKKKSKKSTKNSGRSKHTVKNLRIAAAVHDSGVLKGDMNLEDSANSNFRRSYKKVDQLKSPPKRKSEFDDGAEERSGWKKRQTL